MNLYMKLHVDRVYIIGNGEVCKTSVVVEGSSNDSILHDIKYFLKIDEGEKQKLIRSKILQHSDSKWSCDEIKENRKANIALIASRI